VSRSRPVRWRRVLLLGSLACVLTAVGVVGAVYASTEIPEPSADSRASAVRILYADRSEMGRTGTQNRIPVELADVPEHVQHAVLAAEDRGFYTEPGISPRGIARALLTNVRSGGGVQQGGSTITQQYAKNAFLTSERTYTRKVREVFIALKMSRTLDKDQILEDYLNTIYWGRQASGIAVAARAYFGTDDVSTLTVAQGAVLASSIRSPATLDPTEDPERARARWEYVLDGMVSEGWLTEQERAAQVYPAVLAPGQGPRTNDLSGPTGHVILQVLAELARRGFDEERLSDGGLVVQTTIRRRAQEAAVAAVQEVTGRAPGQEDLQGALVSVAPATGEVWAYYGGATGTGFDFARNSGAGRQPGSTFKPYVLATALEQGMSLNTRLDGNTGQEFPGAREPVENFGGESYGRVDLVEATRRSVNTAYFQLGLAVGPQEVAATAHAAGIPDDTPLANADGSVEGGISLGSYEVQVFDQAVGYATFANRGVPVEPYLVARVSRGDEVLYEAQVRTGERAFSEDVAADATYAMEQVLRRGTGRAARLDGGRDAAGKTGTSSDNRDAWFVGFTPQLSTAVWLGYATPRTIRLDGVEVTGGGSSSRIWKRFMDPALAGQPEVELPDPVYAGTRARLDREPSGTTPRRRRSAPAPAPVGPVAPETTAPAPTSAPPAPPPTTAPEAPQPEAPQPEAPQPEAPQPEAPQPAAPQPEVPPEPAAPAPSGAG
jgi:membrane peptidoglycan carboxypeptidase